MTPRTRKNILIGLLFVLTLSAVVLGVSWMSGCQTKPAPVPTVPQPAEPTPPPPDVGECKANIRSMQTAVVIARASAKLLIEKESQYGPAVNLALAAIEGALAEAKAQCDSGDVDAWAIALAAFDKAFADLVVAGDGINAASVPNDIGPPPPYAVSLEEFNAQAFEKEMEYQ